MKAMPRILTFLLFTCSAQTGFSQQFFDDEADFLAAIEPDFYFEDFSTVVLGMSGALNFGVVNGFSCTVNSAPGSIGPLFNATGIISTSNGNDQVRFSFTGDPVTAFGGNIYATDIGFNNLAATVTITLDDSSAFSFPSNSTNTFAGWVSDGTPIAFVDIDASTGGGPLSWVAVAEFYVGTASMPGPVAIPALSAAGLWLTAALTLVPGLIMLRRRRGTV